MMNLISTLSMIIMLISIIMMLMAILLSKKEISDREKSTPFECGFNPKNSARTPFSLQFFLIAIMFLIFDIEITLILPFIFELSSNFLMISLVFSVFIMILLVGLYHEWLQGMLSWKI
uniref:NADH-ubiquinone oxidoreductase chain 3 n=1 Tax=Eucnemidae sp. 4 ACP-2013 TaxID=1434503 RepID=A0A3G4RY78_9COLE|nr:NADH dehydrogenase subunit 3 [Eucnemidae sp. 4 ACP-2013]